MRPVGLMGQSGCLTRPPTHRATGLGWAGAGLGRGEGSHTWFAVWGPF